MKDNGFYVLALFILLSIVPVVVYSQPYYLSAVEESYSLCVYCDWNCVLDGTCMHCGKEQ